MSSKYAQESLMPEPVAYDKSITRSGSLWRAVVREDDQQRVFMRATFEGAQQILDCFRPDVFEGAQLPPSVFWKGRVCETLVM
jgi:hypothetical protein